MIGRDRRNLHEEPFVTVMDPTERYADHTRHDDLPGYSDGLLSTAEVADAAGVSYRRLDYWIRVGAAVQAVQEANGSGSRRRFDRSEIRVVRAVAALMEMGCTVEEAAVAAAELRMLVPAAWHGSHVTFGRVLNLDALAGE